MSSTKLIGALAGGVIGMVAAGLYAHDVTSQRAAIVASLLLGVLVGAALGSFVGSADR